MNDKSLMTIRELEMAFFIYLYYEFLHVSSAHLYWIILCIVVDDGKLRMIVTETSMLSDGEANGKVTCKVVVGKYIDLKMIVLSSLLYIHLPSICHLFTYPWNSIERRAADYFCIHDFISIDLE